MTSLDIQSVNKATKVKGTGDLTDIQIIFLYDAMDVSLDRYL